METYKIQLNYSVRENASHEVLDHSLLANIRASDVTEAVELYHSLRTQLPELKQWSGSHYRRIPRCAKKGRMNRS